MFYIFIYLFIDQTNAALVSIRYFQKSMYLFIYCLFVYFHLTDEKQYIYNWIKIYILTKVSK